MSSCYAPSLESLGIKNPLKPQIETIPVKNSDPASSSLDDEMGLEGLFWFNVPFPFW